jgi:hypothetical protein
MINLVGLFSLILTNLALIPSIVLTLKQNKWSESITFTWNLIGSVLFHICELWKLDDIHDVTYMNLLSIDTFFSINTLIFVSFKLADIKRKKYKFSGVFLLSGICTITNAYTVSTHNEHKSFEKSNIFILCICVLLFLFRIFYSNRDLKYTLKQYITIFTLFIVGGLSQAIVFLFEIDNENYQYILHGVWHMCLYIGIFLTYYLRNLKNNYNYNNNKITI